MTLPLQMLVYQGVYLRLRFDAWEVANALFQWRFYANGLSHGGGAFAILGAVVGIWLALLLARHAARMRCLAALPEGPPRLTRTLLRSFAAYHPFVSCFLLLPAQLPLVWLVLYVPGSLASILTPWGVVVLYVALNFPVAFGAALAVSLVRRRAGMAAARLYALVPVALCLPGVWLFGGYVMATLHLICPLSALWSPWWPWEAVRQSIAMLLARAAALRGIFLGACSASGVGLALGILTGQLVARRRFRTGRWTTIAPLDVPGRPWLSRFMAERPLVAGPLLLAVHFVGLLLAGLGLFTKLSAADAVAGMIVLWYWWSFLWTMAVGAALALLRRRSGLSGRRLFALVPMALVQCLVHLAATVAILRSAVRWPVPSLEVCWDMVLRSGWRLSELHGGLFLAAVGCLMGIVIGLRAAHHLQRTGRWEHIEPVDRPPG